MYSLKCYKISIDWYTNIKNHLQDTLYTVSCHCWSQSLHGHRGAGVRARCNFLFKLVLSVIIIIKIIIKTIMVTVIVILIIHVGVVRIWSIAPRVRAESKPAVDDDILFLSDFSSSTTLISALFFLSSRRFNWTQAFFYTQSVRVQNGERPDSVFAFFR